MDMTDCESNSASISGVFSLSMDGWVKLFYAGQDGNDQTRYGEAEFL